MEPRRAPNGYSYLNVGCGSQFSKEWTNLDQRDGDGVIGHDLRKPLPFDGATFDVTYSSHVLEHFVPKDAEAFLREQWRVLKPGGICRVVVPDLERLCRDYLAHLDHAAKDPAPGNVLDYQWTVLQLIDQMVREECGGEMLRVLREGRFNPEFVRRQVGDEASFVLDQPASPSVAKLVEPTLAHSMKKQLKRVLGRDARGQGEAHRWMYDRLSLRLLLERLGFSGCRVLAYSESSIPDWPRYALDTSRDGAGPRKPDSLFVEAVKPE